MSFKSYREVIKEEKLIYGQKEALRALRKVIRPSESYSTAIRGYRRYSKGYELNNSYDVSYITLHGCDDNDVKLIKESFEKFNIPYLGVDTQGINLDQVRPSK